MRTLLLACLLVAAAALAMSCGSPAQPPSPGSYQVLQKYTEYTQPPVTLGKSVITLPPLMDFPPGSQDLYKACLRDVARINNVDYGG